MSSGDARGERGVTTLTTIVVMTLSLLFFVNLAQVVVWQYGRGSVRAALDEAARAGAGTHGGIDTCERRAGDVLADLLGGSMGDEVVVRCIDLGTELVAEATVTFRSWLPPTPDWSFTARAAMPFEPGTAAASA